MEINKHNYYQASQSNQRINQNIIFVSEDKDIDIQSNIIDKLRDLNFTSTPETYLEYKYWIAI